MLTIRIDLNDTSTVFSAACAIRGTHAALKLAQVEFFDADYKAIHTPAMSGTVYVMNDAGKTVATYHLDTLNRCETAPAPTAPTFLVEHTREHVGGYRA